MPFKRKETDFKPIKVNELTPENLIMVNFENYYIACMIVIEKKTEEQTSFTVEFHGEIYEVNARNDSEIWVYKTVEDRIKENK